MSWGVKLQHFSPVKGNPVSVKCSSTNGRESPSGPCDGQEETTCVIPGKRYWNSSGEKKDAEAHGQLWGAKGSLTPARMMAHKGLDTHSLGGV